MCNSLQGNKNQYILYCAVGISLCSKGFPEKAKLAENWIEGCLGNGKIEVRKVLGLNIYFGMYSVKDAPQLSYG